MSYFSNPVVTYKQTKTKSARFCRANGLGIEIIGIPNSNRFIQQNLELISPRFRLSQCHAIAILQEVSEQLISTNDRLESIKNKCRDDFILWGVGCIRALQGLGFGDSNLIDPRTGRVILGGEGEIPINFTPLFQQKLQFNVESYGDCNVAIHPKWGTAYYPGILLTAAQPQLVISVMKHIFPSLEPSCQLVDD